MRQDMTPLLYKIDEDEGSVVPVNTYKQLHPQSTVCGPDGVPLGLTSSNTTTTAFGGHAIQHYGHVNSACQMVVTPNCTRFMS